MKRKTVQTTERTPTQECALCLQVSVLQESHLLPAAVYRHLRDAQSQNPHPVMFSEVVERQSCRQVKRPLLCSACEQRFNFHGENWTLKHSAHQSNQFKLRDILLKHECSKVMEGWDCFYCEDIPSIKVDALCYFALSMIWRASACTWTFDGAKFEPIMLGKYSEPIRLYLLGEAAFPANAVVTVIMSSLADVHLIATLPQTKKRQGYTSHCFSIPGLDFTVDLGTLIPTLREEICLCRGLRRPIFYSSLATMETAHAYSRNIAARIGLDVTRRT